MTTGAILLKDPFLPVTDDFLRDPYRYYKNLRDNDPVFWSESGKYWIITRYADADTILRDLRFGKSMPKFAAENSLLGKAVIPLLKHFLAGGASTSQSMLNMNPPDHTRLRSLVNKAFTPKMIEKMREHIQQIADDLLNKKQGQKQMDLVADFAFPLPVTVIAEMLGVPPSDQEQFKVWSNALTVILEPGACPMSLLKAGGARNKLVAYLRPLIEKRRKDPQDDLITSLVQAEEEGSRLTPDELLANVILLLVAGHETTVNLISGSLLSLMLYPEQKDLLNSRPELLNDSVDEFLRFCNPVQMVRRYAVEDVEVGGKKIAAGQSIIVSVAAANHDPAKFNDPDKLDLTRTDIKHLAFGMGIHHCLGWSLAVAEGQIALQSVLSRMPNMKLMLNPEQIEWKRPFSLRGPVRLPVSF